MSSYSATLHPSGGRPRLSFVAAITALGAAIVFCSFFFPWVGSGFGSSLSGFELADLATSGATGGLLPPFIGIGLYLIAAVTALLIALAGSTTSWARLIQVGAALVLTVLVLGAAALVVVIGLGAGPGIGLGVALVGVTMAAGSIGWDRSLGRRSVRPDRRMS